MKVKSLQEIYDISATHLLKQNKQSFLAGTGCAYHGLGKLMCAVGPLIPDLFYDTELEGKNASSDRVTSVLVFNGVDVDNPKVIGLLNSLQALHDRSFPESWAKQLVAIAQRFKLTPIQSKV